MTLEMVNMLSNTGINRYIMECKWIDETKAQYGISDGINRYIMECK